MERGRGGGEEEGEGREGRGERPSITTTSYVIKLTPGELPGISLENLMSCSPASRGQVRPVSVEQISRVSSTTVTGIPSTKYCSFTAMLPFVTCSPEAL